MAMGPPMLYDPVFMTPIFSNDSTRPNGIRHATSPVFTLIAKSSPHGGDWHGQPVAGLATEPNVMVVGAPPSPIEGNCMLEAQTQPSTSARGEAEMPSTITSGAFYVRAYYYIPSGFTLDDFSMLEIVQMQSTNLTMISSPYLSLYNGIPEFLEHEGFGPGGRNPRRALEEWRKKASPR